MFIMGIGKSHTPSAFVKACESFTFSEILLPLDTSGIFKSKKCNSKTLSKQGISSDDGCKKAKNSIELNPILSGIKSIDQDQIDSAFLKVVDIDTGQALLSRFAEALRAQDSTFDHRNYGYSSFSKFCDALGPNYSVGYYADGTTKYVREKLPSKELLDRNPKRKGTKKAIATDKKDAATDLIPKVTNSK